MGKEGFEPTICYEDALKASAFNHSAICPLKINKDYNICSLFEIFYVVKQFTIKSLRSLVTLFNEAILFIIVIVGFEPTTSPLSAAHSNQLSYMTRTRSSGVEPLLTVLETVVISRYTKPFFK